MEKKETTIFYLGIAQGEIETDGKRKRRSGLPIRCLEKKLEYPGGYVKVSYALLPEFAGKRFCSKGGRAWQDKVKQAVLEKTLERAQRENGYSEVVVSPELSANEKEIPLVLRAVYLHRYAPLEGVTVVFSGESGTFEAREAILLLAPYLKRVKQVTICGKEGAATELFSEYLFYEYGIVPERSQRIGKEGKQSVKKRVVLDFEEPRILAGETFGTFDVYGYINNEETLKFLDTTIKNGYNTES